MLFFSNNCYPGSSCPPDIIMLYAFFDKSTRGLMADPDLMIVTAYHPLELLVIGMLFDTGLILMAGYKSGLSPFVRGMSLN